MKTKAEIIEMMQNENITYIGLKKKTTDKLGMLYHLTPKGNLVDCYSKNVGKTTTFEVRIEHKDGKPYSILI